MDEKYIGGTIRHVGENEWMVSIRLLCFQNISKIFQHFQNGLTFFHISNIYSFFGLNWKYNISSKDLSWTPGIPVSIHIMGIWKLDRSDTADTVTDIIIHCGDITYIRLYIHLYSLVYVYNKLIKMLRHVLTDRWVNRRTWRHYISIKTYTCM